jgi:hypothetical protein
MAETKTLNVRLQQKYDTAANWLLSETILLPGEMAVESDTGKFKFGDGEHVFKDLSYAGIDQAQLDAIEDNYYSIVATNDDDDDTWLATIIGPSKGDIAVVKRSIVEGTDYMTAYMYNGSAWSALDGNYSASNVFLKDDITLAGNYSSIGNYSKGKKINKGTSLQSMLMDMLSQRLQPGNPTNPAASITLYTDGSAKKVAAGAVEVGTTINPFYVASLSKGSYTYGPSDTGVTATSYAVSSTGRKTVDGATDATVEDSSTSSSGAFTSFVVDDDTKYSVSVSIPHSAGVVALDNLGSESNPKKQIAAGTKSKTSGEVSGYRAWFCGYKNGDNALADPTAITGAQVRALGNAANGSWLGSMDVTKMKQMFFAAPAGKGYKPVIKDASTTAPQTVQGPITVSVEGANSFTAIDYDVYYVANASAASGSATLNITKN